MANLGDDDRTAIRRNDIGFVYQFHHLLPEFSALENIMMPQLVHGLSRAAAASRAEQLLDYMKIGKRAQHRPSEFPAANSSASPSPARWPTRRSSCWPTSRPAISTR